MRYKIISSSMSELQRLMLKIQKTSRNIIVSTETVNNITNLDRALKILPINVGEKSLDGPREYVSKIVCHWNQDVSKESLNEHLSSIIHRRKVSVVNPWICDLLDSLVSNLLLSVTKYSFVKNIDVFGNTVAKRRQFALNQIFGEFKEDYEDMYVLLKWLANDTTSKTNMQE